MSRFCFGFFEVFFFFRDLTITRHSYSSKVQVDVESNRIREFEQVENTGVNLKKNKTKKKLVRIQSSWLDGFSLDF